MSPKAAKPGASQFKAIRKALEATGSPSQEDKDAALAAVNHLEAEFTESAKSREDFEQELKQHQQTST